ncbi:uncharacterized protein CTHT_0011290 [Thermochaetoides thermophila DSM 1495]|uniref:Uncharacterized protein n=1 Tax=Chaetomium thermophilum (strain DSM 1495 / CBS 144.50 / IMI 039719) TaxID=759272 RepID=G0S0U7_CHATD|nr:hypothetical protein CTHT_0011290 [Thermochaetoides thermophila DSM 1495]EGS22657.1 hypothetical protein CTHT_0011290 [Thermochaetoides thermophila DSM 1495]
MERDDAAVTITTTDYDSDDPEEVDDVFEGENVTEKPSNQSVERSKEKKPGKTKSPRQKKAFQAKPNITKCTCGGNGAEGDAENAKAEKPNEEKKEKEQEEARRRQSVPGATLDSNKKKASLRKSRRSWSPYIEEYPEVPRPTIRLKEHKIQRTASMIETKYDGETKDSLSPSKTRGKSLTKKRRSRPHRQSSKESSSSSQSSRHQKHRKKSHKHRQNEQPSDSGIDGVDFDVDEPCLSLPHSAQQELSPDMSSNLATRGSSSPKKHKKRHKSRKTKSMTLSVHNEQQGYQRASKHSVVNSERGKYRSQSRPRRRTMLDALSIVTLDTTHRDVVGSVCDVWRAQPEDYEYPESDFSAAESDDDGPRSVRLLGVEDLPPRRHKSSPYLPPPDGHRGDFDFQASCQQPRPPSTIFTRNPTPTPIVSSYKDVPTIESWALTRYKRPTASFLKLDEPQFLNMEPESFDHDDYEHHDFTRFGQCHSVGLRNFRLGPPVPTHRRHRGRPNTYPPPAGPQPTPLRPPQTWTYPRHRETSPAPAFFAARRTREFLAPKPRRAAERFDFNAWGCDRASKSSLTLGLY